MDISTLNLSNKKPVIQVNKKVRQPDKKKTLNTQLSLLFNEEGVNLRLVWVQLLPGDSIDNLRV